MNLQDPFRLIFEPTGDFRYGPMKTVNEIIKAKAMITADTALQLERVLGAPARFWLNLEANYREDLARLEQRQELERESEWLRPIPHREMDKYGWIDTTSCTSDADRLEVVLKYFGVASVDGWSKIWTSPHATFRKSALFEAAPGPIAAWLRRGEILGRSIICEPYNTRKLQDCLDILAAAARVGQDAGSHQGEPASHQTSKP